MSTQQSTARGRAEPPRVRRSDATTNHRTLLQAAQTVLAENPQASLDTIAQAAGLSRRALYGHFADRESLLREVIALGVERFNTIAATTDDADPLVAIARLAARLWREAIAVRAAANIALSEAHVSATVRSLAPLRQHIRDLTRTGTAAGLFRRDITPEVLAVLIEETARTTLRQVPLDPDGDPSHIVRVVLSIVGLSWTEQADLMAAHPDITAEAHL